MMKKSNLDKAFLITYNQIGHWIHFLSEGGTMYAHIREQLAERHVIANLQELLTQARGRVQKYFTARSIPLIPDFRN